MTALKSLPPNSNIGVPSLWESAIFSRCPWNYRGSRSAEYLQPDPERLESYAGSLRTRRLSLRPDAAGDLVAGEAHCRSQGPGAESTGRTRPSCAIRLTLPAVRCREAQLPTGAGRVPALPASGHSVRGRLPASLCGGHPAGEPGAASFCPEMDARQAPHLRPGTGSEGHPCLRTGAGGDGGSLAALLSSFPAGMWLEEGGHHQKDFLCKPLFGQF